MSWFQNLDVDLLKLTIWFLAYWRKMNLTNALKIKILRDHNEIWHSLSFKNGWETDHKAICLNFIVIEWKYAFEIDKNVCKNHQIYSIWIFGFHKSD